MGWPPLPPAPPLTVYLAAVTARLDLNPQLRLSGPDLSQPQNGLDFGEYLIPPGVLGTDTDLTVLRKLKQLGYLASYMRRAKV